MKVFKMVAALVVGVALLSSGAEAKTRKSMPVKAPVVEQAVKPWWQTTGEPELVRIAERYIGKNPTGLRRQWCGRFVRLVLQQANLPDFRSGDIAHAWLGYGRRTQPAPGAIAVFKSRHVGIVKEVAGGRVTVISGNWSRTTSVSVHSIRTMAAFVVM